MAKRKRTTVYGEDASGRRTVAAIIEGGACRKCKRSVRDRQALDSAGLCSDCAPVVGGTCRTAPDECEWGRIVMLRVISASDLRNLRLCTGHSSLRDAELKRREMSTLERKEAQK